MSNFYTLAAGVALSMVVVAELIRTAPINTVIGMLVAIFLILCSINERMGK